MKNFKLVKIFLISFLFFIMSFNFVFAQSPISGRAISYSDCADNVIKGNPTLSIPDNCPSGYPYLVPKGKCSPSNGKDCCCKNKIIANESKVYNISACKYKQKWYSDFCDDENRIQLEDSVCQSAGVNKVLGDSAWNKKCCCNFSIDAPLDTTPAVPKPISFTPEVGIPGFKNKLEVNGFLLGSFLIALFNYLIYLSGIFAVMIFIIAGFQWVLAGGNESKISEAKDRIKNAIIGIVLCSSSILILQTINPDLMNIKPLNVETIDPIQLINMEEINFTATGAGCPDYGKDVNGIPASILNKPRSCSPEDIKEVGSLGLGFISGPCHCACFVSNVLKYAGCGIEIDSNVNSLEAQLKAKRWTKSTNKKKNASSLGDVLVIDGHIGISMGDDKVLESGRISEKKPFNGCAYNDTRCKNVWHGLNNADGSRQFMGGNCMSNQYIRIVTDWFRRAGEPGYEKVSNFRFWER